MPTQLEITKQINELDIKRGPTQVVEIITRGPQGIPGPGDAHYVHTQISSSATWVIVHNLNKKPAVTVVDSGDNIVYGDVVYDTLNQLTITFTAPFGGAAYLN